MFKDILKQQQPVVYQTLENALLYHKLAHAYLFYGPAGTPKKDTAVLLVQSLLCEEKGFACEVCDECERIKHGNYADMIVIDGSDTSIKKADIVKLQHEFNKTGLESHGKKVYMIDHVENATADALNSLLKFLEEPSGDMMAILLAEQLDQVLPTIVSRCQLIPFTPLTRQHCYEACQQELDGLDAYLLSSMIRNVEEIKEASESEDYQHARHLFKGFLDNYVISPYRSLLFLQLEGTKNSQKKLEKKHVQYLLSMLDLFFKDCMYPNGTIKDSWYLETIQKFHTMKIDYIQILQVLMNMQDKLLRSVNINLLLDQMVHEMKEATA